jgi:hypothetical protein
MYWKFKKLGIPFIVIASEKAVKIGRNPINTNIVIAGTMKINCISTPKNSNHRDVSLKKFKNL